jgi:FMN reductase
MTDFQPPDHQPPGRKPVIDGIEGRIDMSTLKLVAIVGNLRRPSRSRALVEIIANEAVRQRHVEVQVFDLLDAGPGLGAAFSRNELTPSAAAVVEAVENADALIVGTPVYKGSYTGLFKHLIDFIDPEALAGKPVVLTATGGGQRHALVLEHQLRPLFSFFTAQTLPTSVYASDQDFLDGVLADPATIERARDAAGQLGAALDALSARRPAQAA